MRKEVVTHLDHLGNGALARAWQTTQDDGQLWRPEEAARDGQEVIDGHHLAWWRRGFFHLPWVAVTSMITIS